ncbi:hypothetical protein AGDE_11600 [Angomonas deanei]|nr:hypothetical protein AGDE_11600 [Angomonas deanei]|eukprot:EPY25981.1 hypothetical protein AGDE_11600 [Angomonas deanei]
MFAIEKKYRVLLIFIVFTTNNGFAWLMFEPVTKWLQDNVEGMSHFQLAVLASWQPAVFIAMCIPIMKMVTRFDGLRLAVRLGTTAEIVGAVLKLIGTLARKSKAGLVFLHIGQIFSGVGSPVATGLCLRAVRHLVRAGGAYPCDGRRRAFNTVGNALCYLLVPLMTDGSGFLLVTIYEVIMAVIAVGLAWVAMPQELVEHHDANGETTTDETKDEATEQEVLAANKEHDSLREQIVKLFKMPSIVCLLLVYAWLCGGFAAWVSLFSATYNQFFGDKFIGFMCCAGMSAYVLGGLVSSYVVDLYFTRQMKYVIFFCLTMTTLCNLIFIACTPNDKGYYLWNLGKGFVIFSTALCGFWNGAAAPLFYELVAEISFPVEEGVSGICVSIFENLGALLFLQVVYQKFKGQSMSVAYAFGMTVALALTAIVKQRYNRTYYNYITENQTEVPQEE